MNRKNPFPVVLALFAAAVLAGCQSADEARTREKEEIVEKYIQRVEEDFARQKGEIRASGEGGGDVDGLVETLLRRRSDPTGVPPLREEEVEEHRRKLESKKREIEARLKRLEEERGEAEEKMEAFEERLSGLVRDLERLSRALHILEIEGAGTTRERSK